MVAQVRLVYCNRWPQCSTHCRTCFQLFVLLRCLQPPPSMDRLTHRKSLVFRLPARGSFRPAERCYSSVLGVDTDGLRGPCVIPRSGCSYGVCTYRRGSCGLGTCQPFLYVARGCKLCTWRLPVCCGRISGLRSRGKISWCRLLFRGPQDEPRLRSGRMHPGGRPLVCGHSSMNPLHTASKTGRRWTRSNSNGYISSGYNGSWYNCSGRECSSRARSWRDEREKLQTQLTSGMCCKGKQQLGGSSNSRKKRAISIGREPERSCGRNEMLRESTGGESISTSLSFPRACYSQFICASPEEPAAEDREAAAPSTHRRVGEAAAHLRDAQAEGSTRRARTQAGARAAATESTQALRGKKDGEHAAGEITVTVASNVVGASARDRDITKKKEPAGELESRQAGAEDGHATGGKRRAAAARAKHAEAATPHEDAATTAGQVDSEATDGAPEAGRAAAAGMEAVRVLTAARPRAGKAGKSDGESEGLGRSALSAAAAAVRARTGCLRTQHGDVKTPAFLFCGTRAAVKGVTVDMLRRAGTQIILANTYHLLAYPGPAVIERLGRLQHFTGWRGPMFTDSGGYQIFSLLHGLVADEIKGRRARWQRGAPIGGLCRAIAAAPGRCDCSTTAALNYGVRAAGVSSDIFREREADGENKRTYTTMNTPPGDTHFSRACVREELPEQRDRTQQQQRSRRGGAGREARTPSMLYPNAWSTLTPARETTEDITAAAVLHQGLAEQQQGIGSAADTSAGERCIPQEEDEKTREAQYQETEGKGMKHVIPTTQQQRVWMFQPQPEQGQHPRPLQTQQQQAQRQQQIHPQQQRPPRDEDTGAHKHRQKARLEEQQQQPDEEWLRQHVQEGGMQRGAHAEQQQQFEEEQISRFQEDQYPRLQLRMGPHEQTPLSTQPQCRTQRESWNACETPNDSALVVRISEEGVTFRSYYTGELILLTPEKAVEAQYQLGADFIVALDECTPSHAAKHYVQASMRRSHRWGLRCLRHLQYLRTRDGFYEGTFPRFDIITSPATFLSSDGACYQEPPVSSSTSRGVLSSFFSLKTSDVSQHCVCRDDARGAGKSAASAPRERKGLFVESSTSSAHTAAAASPSAAAVACTRTGTNGQQVSPHPQQGLYGVVQGGVYLDLRRESAAFVNEHDFFGAAIGGSLGIDRQQMHAIVSETAAMLRKDRPIHLLGIGGMLDIFHGVKQGIDSFDCVQPTRAGRHGSALVPRAFWDDTAISSLPPAAAASPAAVRPAAVSPAALGSTCSACPSQRPSAAAAAGCASSLIPHAIAFSTHSPTDTPSYPHSAAAAAAGRAASFPSNDPGVAAACASQQVASAPSLKADTQFHSKGPVPSSSFSCSPSSFSSNEKKTSLPWRRLQPSALLPRSARRTQQHKVAFPFAAQRVKEYVDIGNAFFKLDDRPILPGCACYACTHFSRGYIHYLLKARESLGGVLVTVHNVFTVNALMASIRHGIATGTLEEVEQRWIHPSLAAEVNA